MSTHTVEKIGGTSMSRTDELTDTLLLGGREGADLYNRIFVVSAYGGITDLLLEAKKTGTPGVYGLFAASDSSNAWSEALDRTMQAMVEVHSRLLEHPADRRAADGFIRERIEGARSCLIDLQRLCSYGHFQLDEHMMTIRELLSGLGETHSAYTTALLLQRKGVNARFVDLTGWRDERQPTLDERIEEGLRDVDLTTELPIVTGYAQCREGLIRLYDRGYTEVTFARLAAATKAREAVIHKEFHLSSADPKIVGAEAVRKIGQTNFDVADHLSNLGMEAIHPRAAKILRQSDIPLRVANAFEPADPGTLIDADLGGVARVEIVTGLNVLALEVFEQDMVGVKGYDATILKALTRHAVRIVSKHSNANTITHYLDASLKAVRRVEHEIAEAYPSARVHIQKVALVAAVGRNLKGISAGYQGLRALDEADIVPIATHQGGRAVDVQFVVGADQMNKAIQALHAALVEATDDAAWDACVVDDTAVRSAA
ncbi:aspartate kinase [Breoghania sp. L-A4]|uniref:aspartate kinase n=1 Tax=Breoghania sp. L-A4 TaxID=2304600 RepID=UPI000E35B4CC|nr:aspartate kinase [Breoghania sp. L-A4]AXS42599.1 aspartate kinase [Breoghania sp. L-A4]